MFRHSPVVPSGTFLSDDMSASPGTRGPSTYLGFLTDPLEQKERKIYKHSEIKKGAPASDFCDSGCIYNLHSSGNVNYSRKPAQFNS
ncbi:hypothetical protein PO909_032971 [Leuciscus waleckii]